MLAFFCDLLYFRSEFKGSLRTCGQPTSTKNYGKPRMNSGVRTPRSLLPGSRANTMMFNLQRLTSLTIILFLYPFTAVVFAASSPGNGELLYRKHCGGCHPDPVALMPSEKMVSLMREPPAAMPAFGEDRLPESDARAIADFIRRGRSAGKTSAPAAAAVQASRPANQSRAEPAAIPARTVPAAEAVIPVPGNREKNPTVPGRSRRRSGGCGALSGAGP